MKCLIAVLALALLSYIPAHACRCYADDRPIAPRIQEARNRSDVIFYGHAIFSKEDNNGTSTTLLVEQSWTPGIPRIVTVSSGQFCGYSYFKIGHSYTVFADRSDKWLSVSTCGLTSEGLPEDYRTTLGPGHRTFSYANLWWRVGGTLWIATFAFLKLRGRFKQTY